MNDDFMQDKESISADTNGLGSVVIQLHAQGQVIHLTPEQSRALAGQLIAKATDADFQNSVL
ncbi:hypothetical protein [Pseudomonas putida]|uniref:Uncharacterized protein n=1 Tax=Pseudomonas putida TaxID=303 RepID=A0A8I1JJ28_PSEPU|nr:hypothetical protein [Pseudomonas putida]MBI6883179.1 hypothetical protein [Pseudomonas putida]